MANVDTSAWDGAAAMSAAANSDDPAAAYAAICAGRRDGDPALQSTWALPHHKAPSDPPNADGVRNALSRLPQTEGLTNEEAAHTHLQNHLSDVQAAAGEESAPLEVMTLETPIAELTLSEKKRRLGLKIAPWGVVGNSKYGPIMFERGAFIGLDGGPVDPRIVRLRMDHVDPPTGLGEEYSDKPDAAYMDFGVAKTSRGDDQIALALDGTSAGASVGFAPYQSRQQRRRIDGRDVLVFPRASAVLAEVSTTWQPTFGEAGVQYVLHLEEKGDGPVAEDKGTPAVGAEAAPPAVIQAVDTSGIERLFAQFQDRMEGRLERIEEVRRQDIVIPKPQEPSKPALFQWASAALRLMGGDRVSQRELQTLALDDVITDENPGLVPPAYRPELLVEITQGRPFLASTNEFPAPDVGMSITVPVIDTEPTAGVQANEKTDIESTALKVTLDSFDAVTIAGGADVSIQMLKRATNTFLDLFVRRLAEAYARNADAEAISALQAATVSSGGTLDPEDMSIGAAWANAISNYGKAPDTIWLSSDGVQAFIDAKANTTNQPLYGNLGGAFSVAGGAGGNISGLRPVYVPAFDGAGLDVLIGPSRAFAWAEDGTYTLRADNPSKAGQDIALVGMMFFVPEAPLAFTSYTV